MSPEAVARLAPRLQALFAVHRPPAVAAALTAEALRRAEALPDDAAAEAIHAIARALLEADDSAPAPVPDAELDALEAAPDPALRKALRLGLARLGTDAARLLLGYYGFGADGGGDTAASRQQRRSQLAVRFGLDPSALRGRALALREQLEAEVAALAAAADPR